jgi:hypothetical protein
LTATSLFVGHDSMDPVSALSVAGVALQLAGLCVKIPTALGKLKDRYNDAPKTIRTIRSVCKTAEIIAKNISTWLRSEIIIDEATLVGLQEILHDYSETVQEIAEEIDRITGIPNGGSLGRGERASVALNQDHLQEHLQALQYLSTSLHLLLDSTKL